jgi:hypothetical protein
MKKELLINRLEFACEALDICADHRSLGEELLTSRLARGDVICFQSLGRGIGS